MTLATTLPPPHVDQNWRAVILVVDDDQLGAQRVAEMITKLGHSYVVASTWTAALREFNQQNIDLVLMDAVMPTVDGFKLTRLLREKARSYVPIVFLTGLTDNESRRRGIESGADDLLTKPVDEIELQVRLMAMLRIRRLTQALEMRTRRLAKLATVDALTGLLNRRVLEERLPQELATSRESGAPLAFMMVDVDHFKAVNDRYGHDAGDQVLAFMGHVIDAVSTQSDFAFRFGGEEFALLLPNSGRERAGTVAEELRGAFRQRSAVECSVGQQTLSVGVVSTESFPGRNATPSQLMKAADDALYRAKRTGRDRVVVVEADVSSEPASDSQGDGYPDQEMSKTRSSRST